MLTCQNCGRTLSDGVPKCANCGAADPLREREPEVEEGVRKCHTCGERLRRGEKGCAFCGARRQPRASRVSSIPQGPGSPVRALWIASALTVLLGLPVILEYCRQVETIERISRVQASPDKVPRPRPVQPKELESPASTHAHAAFERVLTRDSDSYIVPGGTMMIVWIQASQKKTVRVDPQTGPAVDVALFDADVWRQYATLKARNEVLDHQVEVMAGRRLSEGCFTGELYPGHTYCLVMRCPATGSPASVLVRLGGVR